MIKNPTQFSLLTLLSFLIYRYCTPISLNYHISQLTWALFPLVWLSMFVNGFLRQCDKSRPLLSYLWLLKWMQQYEGRIYTICLLCFFSLVCKALPSFCKKAIKNSVWWGNVKEFLITVKCKSWREKLKSTMGNHFR